MFGAFIELGIPWHDPVAGGGAPALRPGSSASNAQGRMVEIEPRIKRAFGSALDIAEVLQIEPGRLLTSEHIGNCAYFGEGARSACRGGAHRTSVDAAFRYRTGRRGAGSPEMSSACRISGSTSFPYSTWMPLRSDVPVTRVAADASR